MEDWYSVTDVELKAAGGAPVLASRFVDSPCVASHISPVLSSAILFFLIPFFSLRVTLARALAEVYPDYDWLPWAFPRVEHVRSDVPLVLSFS